MKDSSLQSKIYSFSVLDDVSDLELESDAAIQNIKINDMDDVCCYIQSLYNTIRPPSTPQGGAVFDMEYAIKFYNILNSYHTTIGNCSVDISNKHINYIESVLSELSTRVLNDNGYKEYLERLFNQKFTCKLVTEYDTEIEIPEFMLNIISTLYYAYNHHAIVFTALTYHIPSSLITFINDIISNKYAECEKYLIYEQILKYSI